MCSKGSNLNEITRVNWISDNTHVQVKLRPQGNYKLISNESKYRKIFIYG